MKLTSKDDLSKPTVEVQPADVSTEEAVERWRDSAFFHARRAEELLTGLRGVRDQINEILAEDGRKLADQDKDK